MNNSSDDRSAIARAYGWAAQIITISLEMALPALGGFWLDEKLGTKILFLIIGALLGFFVGFRHLLKLASRLNQNRSDRHNND